MHGRPIDVSGVHSLEPKPAAHPASTEAGAADNDRRATEHRPTPWHDTHQLHRTLIDQEAEARTRVEQGAGSARGTERKKQIVRVRVARNRRVRAADNVRVIHCLNCTLHIHHSIAA